MGENRLFQMVYLLLDKEYMTAPELAKRFEVSVRTIYRDVDILSGAGIPIYTTQGKGGGISIQENFVLNKSLISGQEQEQLLMALQGISIVDENYTSALFQKLSGIFRKQNINWIEVDFSDWIKNKADENIFAKIKSAIFQHKQVVFLYYGSNGEATKRTVEPLKLVFKSKDWFLYGYCCFRDDNRLFKLTRMKEFEMTENTFARAVPLQVSTHTKEFFENTIDITIKFDKTQSFRVYDEFLEGVVRKDDGGFLVTTKMPNNERLFSYLFSFEDTVEVIAPDFLRAEIQSRIKKMQEKYIT